MMMKGDRPYLWRLYEDLVEVLESGGESVEGGADALRVPLRVQLRHVLH